MRSIWKGSIQFSLVSIPVRLYSGIDKESELKFNQLNKTTMNRVAYIKQDSVTGDTLSTSDIIKGYRNGDDYVIVEEDDFNKVKCESTKVFAIQGFVDPSTIDLALYDSLYIVGPDGDPAKKFYNLFTKALKNSGKAAIGKLVIRQRERTMLVVARGNGIAMYQLKSPKQIRDINSVVTDVPQVDSGELQMAQTLIDQMSISFDDIDLKDKYQEGLLKVIQNKIDGVEEEDTPVVKKAAAPAQDMMALLKASIDQNGK